MRYHYLLRIDVADTEVDARESSVKCVEQILFEHLAFSNKLFPFGFWESATDRFPVETYVVEGPRYSVPVKQDPCACSQEFYEALNDIRKLDLAWHEKHPLPSEKPEPWWLRPVWPFSHLTPPYVVGILLNAAFFIWVGWMLHKRLGS